MARGGEAVPGDTQVLDVLEAPEPVDKGRRGQIDGVQLQC